MTMTKLETAQRKLEKIRMEQKENSLNIRKEHDLIPFGQPNIIGRPDIYKKVKRHYEKGFKLIKEEKVQENRIDMLEKVKSFKEENDLLKDVHVVGKSGYASVGAKTSVNNLDYFKAKLTELLESNERVKAYNKTKPLIKMKTLGADITKLKRKISLLEDMENKQNNQIFNDKTQELIENKSVTQWKKKPIYYFVTGLRKVALEINENGDFYVSSRYPAVSEEDKNFITQLLNKDC